MDGRNGETARRHKRAAEVGVPFGAYVKIEALFHCLLLSAERAYVRLR